MKKTLLFVALMATSLVAHATVYNFGYTNGNYTLSQVVVSGLTAETTAITDTALVVYDEAANAVGSLSISTMPNFVFGYTNTSGKNGIIKIYPNVIYTAGKGVTLTISNVTIGDSLIIATEAKGATADQWIITSGATTTSNLAPNNAAMSYIRLLATDVTISLKENNGGFKLLSINWFSNGSTAINKVLADKGISFNGTEILNTKGLALEVYSVLGKRVATSMTSIRTANFQKGVYVVRVAGSNDALKICI
jgi:hypothetical protein